MSAKLDLASLFERTNQLDRWRTQPYRTAEVELDAVKVRKKGMSMISSTRGDVEADPHFAKLFRMAVDRGLTMLIDPDEPIVGVPHQRQPATIFILHHDQMWRVPAFRALWATYFAAGSWTNAAEAQMSLLLGYTAKERALWMAQLRWERAAWGCATLYTLLTREQRTLVVALGKRCLGTPESIAGMSFFVHRREHQMKKRAAKLVPKGFTLARFALRHDAAWEIIGHPRNRARRAGVIARSVGATQAQTVNSALTSSVEFLGARGWG